MAMVDGLHVEVADLPGDRDRRALVLLHEGLGSVGLWRGFPQALHEATGRRVVAFSRFGHGRSDPPRAPRTPAFFHEEAEDVLPALLAALDAPEPVLVGHSDGASIALVHAARHPVSRPGAAGAARLRRGGHGGGDPRHAPRVRGGRAAGADGPPPRRSRRRLLGVVRRVAGSRLPRRGASRPTRRRSRRRRCSSRAPTTPTAAWSNSTASRRACAGRCGAWWSRAATARTWSSPRRWWRRSRTSRRGCPDSSSRRRAAPRGQGRARQRSAASAASVRSLKRCTLPLGVRGSSSTKRTRCGYS